MAKPENKYQQHRGTGKVHLDKDDDDALGEAQDEREREQAKPDDEDPDKKEKEEKHEKHGKADKDAEPKIAGDVVTINMFVDVDPAPTVGHPGHGGYSFIEHGIMKLEARKSYVVPVNVADVLADKKMCSIAGA